MRVRVLVLFALVPGLMAAQSFAMRRLPSLDLSPTRWLKTNRPAAKPAFSLASKTEVKAPAGKMFASPPGLETKPCAVDLRLVPPAKDSDDMPLVPLPGASRTPEVKLPAPPCGTAKSANERK
jgi:hypothetical protein